MSCDVVMDGESRQWLIAAFASPPLQREVVGVVARFVLRFDFRGELLIDSCNSAACELLASDATGAAAHDFMRCRRVLSTSYDVPKETQSLEGECRMLRLKLPRALGWTRVHCFGSMLLSESPFDDKMWVRSMYMTIVNVFSA